MTLSVDKLDVARSGRLLVRAVSLTCDPGTALMLRGPNGVGKTTLLRTLAGFIPITRGDAILDGHSLCRGDGFQELLAYGGHADGLKGQMTVAENLRFWAQLHGQTEAITAAMARFDLAAIGDRLAANCSAGQKRRAGLARLVLSGRPLWLLDEPTVSLDAASRSALAEALRAHLASGGMVVLATHDPDLIDGAKTVTLAPAQPADAESDDPFLQGAFA